MKPHRGFNDPPVNLIDFHRSPLLVPEIKVEPAARVGRAQVHIVLITLELRLRAQRANGIPHRRSRWSPPLLEEELVH
jgi:hypothetical protein